MQHRLFKLHMRRHRPNHSLPFRGAGLSSSGTCSRNVRSNPAGHQKRQCCMRQLRAACHDTTPFSRQDMEHTGINDRRTSRREELVVEVWGHRKGRPALHGRRRKSCTPRTGKWDGTQDVPTAIRAMGCMQAEFQLSMSARRKLQWVCGEAYELLMGVQDASLTLAAG